MHKELKLIIRLREEGFKELKRLKKLKQESSTEKKDEPSK